MSLCPCGTQKNYEDCCRPYLNEQQIPHTPEQLMRSRYTAYSQANINYIKKTMRGKPLMHFNEQEAKHWAESVVWLHLTVVESTLETPERGFVEFIAAFMQQNQLKTIHERSEFHQYDQRWFYIDGINKKEPTKKLARNSPCPCGSGKKFKNCHAQ